MGGLSGKLVADRPRLTDDEVDHVVDALKGVHEWNGGGLHGTSDPGANKGSDCYILLRVQGDMAPVVPLVVVGRVGAVAVGLLLGDEGPLLIELDLGRPGG